MHPAIKVDIDRPTTQVETKLCAQLIKSLDRLLVEHDISPITWTADSDDEKVHFVAYIPADCLADLDRAADVIASCYDEFNYRTEQ